ncbi:MAG: ABC transporter substrate-binding protein [Lautropia sp.]
MAQPRSDEPNYAKPLPIKIGWNPSTVPIYQFAAALQRTDIPAFWGLEPTAIPFSSAAEMISAAASGAIDVYWSSDGPIGGAVARGVRFAVVAEQAGWLQGVAVKKASAFKSLADLRGRKIGVHEGTTTSLYARDLLQKAGVDAKEVTWVNVPIGEQAGAWVAGAVDAVMSWNPTLELLPDSRMLYYDSVGVGKPFPGTIIAVKPEFLQKDREKVVRFLGALMHANLWAVQNAQTVNAWYSREVKLDPAVLQSMLDAEPLWGAKRIEDLDYRITTAHMDRMSDNANAFARIARLDAKVDYRKFVDNSAIEEAMRRAVKRVPQAGIKVVRA